jgi:hypothetical protein
MTQTFRFQMLQQFQQQMDNIDFSLTCKLINNDDIIASEFEAVNLKKSRMKDKQHTQAVLEIYFEKICKRCSMIRQAPQSFCDFREQNILSESFVFL